jgi:hypothetical protein
MGPKNVRVPAVLSLVALLVAIPSVAQGNRGKAELKAGAGVVTVDYGRPSSPGKDRVKEQGIGDVWRMGKDAATTLTTSAPLAFGAAKVPKGSYSLFLKKTAAEKYELIFNSKTGIWGTDYDKSTDVAKVPMKKETLPKLVETFTIELQKAAQGGTIVLLWGTTKLSADFELK